MVSRRRTGTGRCFIEIELKSLRFAVVGAGRLGASLALALQPHGPSLLGYVARTPEGRARADVWLGASASASLQDLVSLRPHLYFIAVPDAVLPDVAAELSALLRPEDGPFVAHTSGATSVSALEPCARAGARTFVFHPLQTFPDPSAATDRFRGAAVAITPGIADDRQRETSMGFDLARLVEARPFLLDDEHRLLYHAAAAVACNYSVTLQHLARDMFIRSGLPADDALSMFLPLVRTTLDNIESQGATQALTGPLSRGDVDTIRGHLAAISNDAKEVELVYRTLGLATLSVVRDRQEVSDAVLGEMADLLKSSLGTLVETID